MVEASERALEEEPEVPQVEEEQPSEPEVAVPVEHPVEVVEEPED